MLDIIVLMDNNLDSLVKTLGSISFQNYKDIKVFIINNTNIDLKDKLDLFNDLTITTMDCSSSYLKIYGLNCGDSPYIMFINSGDLLYNCFSVSNIMNDCKDYDLITGKIAIGYGGKVDFYDDLIRYTYGKLYSRNFIDMNNLKFIYSKFNGDLVFNKQFLMCKPRTGLCNKEVYFTFNKIDDDNSKEYIIDYCKSFKICIEESIEKNLDSKLISKTLYSNMSFLYNKYNINYDKKYINCIFKYGLDIYNYYRQFEEYLSLKDKDKINIDYRLDIDYKCSMNDFLDIFTVKSK